MTKNEEYFIVDIGDENYVVNLSGSYQLTQNISIASRFFSRSDANLIKLTSELEQTLGHEVFIVQIKIEDSDNTRNIQKVAVETANPFLRKESIYVVKLLTIENEERQVQLDGCKQLSWLFKHSKDIRDWWYSNFYSVYRLVVETVEHKYFYIYNDFQSTNEMVIFARSFESERFYKYDR